MIKKLVLSGCLLCTLSANAQQELQADQMYEECRELIHTKRFEEGAKKMKKILGLKLDVPHQVTYNLKLGTLYQDSLMNQKEAMKYFTKAHDLEKKLAAIKTLDKAEDFEDIMGTHFMLSQQADSAKDYKKMQEINECGIRFYELYVRPIKPFQDDDFALDYFYNGLQVNRANALGKQGLYEEASAGFEAALSSMDKLISLPGCSPFFRLSKWNFVMIYAQMYSKNSQYDKALSVISQIVPEMEQAIRVDDKEFHESLKMQAPMYIACIADANYDAGKYNESLQYCDDALTWPESIWVPLIIDRRGRALLKLNREEEAKECWQKVKSIIPQYYMGVTDNPLRDKFGE